MWGLFIRPLKADPPINATGYNSVLISTNVVGDAHDRRHRRRHFVLVEIVHSPGVNFRFLAAHRPDEGRALRAGLASPRRHGDTARRRQGRFRRHRDGVVIQHHVVVEYIRTDVGAPAPVDRTG